MTRSSPTSPSSSFSPPLPTPPAASLMTSSSSNTTNQITRASTQPLAFTASSSSSSNSSLTASSSRTSLSTSSPSSASSRRLRQISQHIMPTHAASFTFFPADIVPQAPEDPLFGLMAAYRADESPDKVDLGIGAYRDNSGKPWVLPVVKKAETIIHNDPNTDHEYLPIAGLSSFTSKAAEVIFGAESPALAEKRAISVQTISGTGAVHLGALFLAKFYAGNRTVYFSDPTWANHNQIFSNVGLQTKTYPYFHKDTRGLDFEGMKNTIQAAPTQSIILLHACAHNPTGVDLTEAQWKELADILRSRGHLPFFDCAYQGFASGNLARDAGAIRYFVEQGFELLVAQSFAKNFGLYGERAGCLHYVAPPQKSDQFTAEAVADTVNRVKSQLAVLQRSEISNPPIYGARVASTVLNDPTLFAEWEENLQTMSGRIIGMRKALRDKLEALGTPGTWNHITDQIGMFSFTGLNETQVQKLRSDFHVYMTKNGRISMAGLNTNNIEYFAKAVDSVVRSTN